MPIQSLALIWIKPREEAGYTMADAKRDYDKVQVRIRKERGELDWGEIPQQVPNWNKPVI